VAYQDAARSEPSSIDSVIKPTDSQRVGTFDYILVSGRWDWSEDVATMLGYHREAAVPSLELLLQHTHFEDRTRVASVLHRIVQGHSVDSRHRIIDKAGDLHWIVLVGNPLKDESGDTVGASGYLIDVTDAVQAGVTAAVSELVKSRAVIEQAKGALIAAHGISADQAFDRLVQRSQHTNIKLRDIAGQFLAAISGKLPARAQADILHAATAQADTPRSELSAGRLPTSWAQ
jgi:PAS domain S-box-containing protein